MAVTSDSVEVRDVVVPCNQDDVGGSRLIIRNAGAKTRVADLGPEDVVFGEGFELDSGDTVTVEIQPGEVVYAVSDAEGTTLKILRS